MLRYIFMGSPLVAAKVLDELCTLYTPPVAVVSQSAKEKGRGMKISRTPVAEVAEKRKLPLVESSRINSDEELLKLKNFNPDVILVLAFGQIFKKPLLSLPKIACLNIHASLLPKYRGAAPIQYAIWNGEEITGVSLQKMTPELDAGDILTSRPVKILPHETSGELLERLVPFAAELAATGFRLIESGQAVFSPQDPTQVSLAPKIQKENGLIDWREPAKKIANQIRAMHPWPVAYTQFGSSVLRIHRAQLTSSLATGLLPGTVQTDSKTYLHVTCGDGLGIQLETVQLENRKALEIKAFLQGFQGEFPLKTLVTP